MPDQYVRIKPYKGKSFDRLVDLIAEAQPIHLPILATLEFDPPVAYADAGETQIDAYVIVNKDRFGPQPLRYIRLPLDIIKKLPEGEILTFEDVVFPTSTHQILDTINERLGLDLVANEVEDIQMDTRPYTLPVQILEGNYAWIPGLYHFQMMQDMDGVRITTAKDIRVTDAGRIRIITVKNP